MKFVIVSGFGCKSFWLKDTREEDSFRFNSFYVSYCTLKNVFRPNIFIDLNSYLLYINGNRKIDISNGNQIADCYVEKLKQKLKEAVEKDDIVLFSVDLIDNDLPAHVNKLFAALKLNFRILQFLSTISCRIYVGGENSKFFIQSYLGKLRKSIENVFIVTGGNLDEMDISLCSDQNISFVYPRLLSNLHCPVSQDESKYITYDYSYIQNVLNLDITKKSSYIKEFVFLSEVGCGNGCAFCCNGLTPVLQKISTSKKLDIIKSYIDNGFNAMTVINCTINKDKDFFHSLCDYITTNKINLHWSAHFDLKNLTLDECQMAFESGCCVASLGVDSLDGLQKKIIHKTLNEDVLLHGIDILHKANIWIRANFILGMPYFNEKEIELFTSFIDDVGRDKLNSVICSRFRVSNTSAIRLYPERFNIHLKIKDPDIFKNIVHRKHFIVDDIMYPTKYMEDNRYSYNDIGKHMKKIMDFIIGQSSEFWNYSKITRTNFVLYFLYDVLKTKERVLEFLNKNLVTVKNVGV